MSDSAREVALAELKFHNERLAAGSEVVTTIGQYIFLLAGAGVLAATQIHEAILVIPLFWTDRRARSTSSGYSARSAVTIARTTSPKVTSTTGK